MNPQPGTGPRAQDRLGQTALSLQPLLDLDLVTASRIHSLARCSPRGPRPGEEMFCGWVRPLDPQSRETADLYVVNRLWWGPVTGDAVARSNHRALTRDFPGEFVGLRDALGARGVALPPDFGNHRLAAAVEGLLEYPLYDEDDHTALIRELADQAWHGWLRSEVSTLLAGGHGIESAGIDDEKLRERFYRLYRDRFGDEHAEAATSVTYPHLDQAVAVLADQLRADRGI